MFSEMLPPNLQKMRVELEVWWLMVPINIICTFVILASGISWALPNLPVSAQMLFHSLVCLGMAWVKLLVNLISQDVIPLLCPILIGVTVLKLVKK